MNVAWGLLAILAVLITAVGKERGLRALFTLIVNAAALYLMLLLMAYGADPVAVTAFGCAAVTAMILFYLNGFNRKTVSSLFSVWLVMLLTLLFTSRLGIGARLQGVNKLQGESFANLSLYVHLDFEKVAVCELFISVLGALADVSVSISSAMAQIRKNDPSVTAAGLLESGMRIGRDVLGTMTNTLLFAYIGGFTAMMIWFDMYRYSLADIINAKEFCDGVFQLLAGGVGVVLIIPATAAMTTAFLLFPGRKGRASAPPPED